MSRKIIKKIGGDRIGSGNKMTVSAHGYGYSTHDVSKVRRTSMSFGTIVPMGMWLLTTGSRLRIKMDALITSNALLYQLYGSAKFQVDVFSARMALYNPKMLLNLNDQGYDIKDIKFPLMELWTRSITDVNTQNITTHQVNPSSLLRYLGVAANGMNLNGTTDPVKRQHNAMWMLMYYQTVKEYYCNRQEKKGMMIHNIKPSTVVTNVVNGGTPIPLWPVSTGTTAIATGANLQIVYTTATPIEETEFLLNNGKWYRIGEMYVSVGDNGTTVTGSGPKPGFAGLLIRSYRIVPPEIQTPKLVEWDLKAVDRMQMKIMSNVETSFAISISNVDELPYRACLHRQGTAPNEWFSINTSQEGLCLGTYQSDVFNNWLDNATINNLNAKSKIKVDGNGEFSIDMLNLTQKLYNYDQRIGVTDGTLDEWREMTYAQVGRSKSLKPVYEGGLSKEIVFDMVVSTASTTEDPLGTIASRGQFGSKHKGGYAQIEGDEEKLVMVLAKITPRLVYNQGNDWTTNLKTLDDLHKPAMDKIGYQNLLTDQMVAQETRVANDGSFALTTYSAGKQPAWQWYRTNYDDALGNMADVEDYKVFGRDYSMSMQAGQLRIKDLTTYIDPMKFNDVFALKSLDAMNFDVQVGMDATLTLVMSEEVIPNL